MIDSACSVTYKLHDVIGQETTRCYWSRNYTMLLVKKLQDVIGQETTRCYWSSNYKMLITNNSVKSTCSNFIIEQKYFKFRIVFLLSLYKGT